MVKRSKTIAFAFAIRRCKIWSVTVWEGVKKIKKSRMQGAGKLKNSAINRMNTDWDKSPPTKEYFDELFRVSKNQVIWGGNYFELPPCRGFIIWDKEQTFLNFSQCEMAWTSFDMSAKLFRCSNRGFLSPDKSEKIHPTQKPIDLYEYLLTLPEITKSIIKGESKILDTHCGSASSLVACEHLGFDYVGFEIDADYYNKAKERLE